MIVGTSTGGIIACALAAGLPTEALVNLYRSLGPRIFHNPMPAKPLEFLRWVPNHLKSAANDPLPFRKALTDLFGQTTLEDVYRKRGIALCIPAVNIEARRSWVFETPHTADRARGNYRLADVCLATSAAPLYFPIAVIDDLNPSAAGHHHAFVDGGLWANNPVVLALVEALELAPPGTDIEIISLTTCPPVTEETVMPDEANWGILDWEVGIKALAAALDSQSSRYTGIVKALAPHRRNA